MNFYRLDALATLVYDPRICICMMRLGIFFSNKIELQICEAEILLIFGMPKIIFPKSSKERVFSIMFNDFSNFLLRCQA